MELLASLPHRSLPPLHNLFFNTRDQTKQLHGNASRVLLSLIGVKLANLILFCLRNQRKNVIDKNGTVDTAFGLWAFLRNDVNRQCNPMLPTRKRKLFGLLPTLFLDYE